MMWDWGFLESEKNVEDLKNASTQIVFNIPL